MTGTNVETVSLSIFKQQDIYKYMELSRLTEQDWYKRFENAKVLSSEEKEFKKSFEKYCENFETIKKKGLGIVMIGNPGTGKTTVARLIGKILYQKGLIKSDNFVETSRSDLVGKYIGHTAKQTREVLESALGGVLFVDEAYTLATGGENDFGREAINEILKFMEDNREDIVIIFAGYTKSMMDFLETNEGLRSRIPNHFNFEDYTVDQLYKIGLLELQNQGYKLNHEKYAEFVTHNYNMSNDNSNGRWIRNQNEKLRKKLALRLLDDINADITTITDEDMESAKL